MLGLVAAVHVLLSVSLVTLVLMHSGRDAGFGGMGFTPASQGGQHIVERNLTRLACIVAVLFMINSIALFYLLYRLLRCGRIGAESAHLRHTHARMFPIA